MKTKIIAITIAAIALSSCGTGYTISFGKNGTVVTPPSEPVVIPFK